MTNNVFPARAGMSPERNPNAGVLRSVPRASGDEPATKKKEMES